MAAWAKKAEVVLLGGFVMRSTMAAHPAPVMSTDTQCPYGAGALS